MDDGRVVGAGCRDHGEVAFQRHLERQMSGHCDLCEAAVITKRHYEDAICWIADCEICQVPMVVWREHNPKPSDLVKHELHERLGEVADEALGEGNWTIDDHMRNIPDHYHAHARRPYFWGRT
jgi:hypothetical protein